MGEPKVVYRPGANASPESELGAIVAAYRYLIFECHLAEKGRIADTNDREGAKGSLKVTSAPSEEATR
jgi:hypothetical protein